MDFALNIDGLEADMTWDKRTSILNDIYTSLMVKRGSFFQNPEFGSRLHLLNREKNTQAKERLAKKYCMEALQWIKDLGRATDILVETERERDRMKLRVQVTQADGQDVSFETFLSIV